MLSKRCRFLVAMAALVIAFALTRLILPLSSQASFIDEYKHIFRGAGIQASMRIERAIYVGYLLRPLLSLHRSLFVAKLLPVIAGTLSFLLLYRIAARVVPERRWRMLLCAIYAASPWVLFNHFYVRMYVLMEVSVLLILLTSFIFIEARPQTSHARRNTLIALSLLLALVLGRFTGDSSGWVPMLVVLIIGGGLWLDLRLDTAGHAKYVRAAAVLIPAIIGGVLLPLKVDLLGFLHPSWLQYTGSAHKFGDYFYRLNIFFTAFFFVGLALASISSHRALRLSALVAACLFLLHGLAGYKLQTLRSIFYFHPLYYLFSVYGMRGRGRIALPVQMAALVSLLVVASNYPKDFFNRPSVPNEIDYRNYAGAFDLIRAQSGPAYAVSCWPNALSEFYEQPFLSAIKPANGCTFDEQALTALVRQLLATPGPWTFFADLEDTAQLSGLEEYERLRDAAELTVFDSHVAVYIRRAPDE